MNHSYRVVVTCTAGLFALIQAWSRHLLCTPKHCQCYRDLSPCPVPWLSENEWEKTPWRREEQLKEMRKRQGTSLLVIVIAGTGACHASRSVSKSERKTFKPRALDMWQDQSFLTTAPSNTLSLSVHHRCAAVISYNLQIVVCQVEGFHLTGPLIMPFQLIMQYNRFKLNWSNHSAKILFWRIRSVMFVKIRKLITVPAYSSFIRGSKFFRKYNFSQTLTFSI